MYLVLYIEFIISRFTEMSFTEIFILVILIMFPFLSRESHFTVEADSAWLDFLTKAVDHNLSKLMEVIPHNSQDSDT